MRKILTRFCTPLLGALGLALAGTAQAAPVPVAVTGYTADVVADGTGAAAARTSIDFDGVSYALMVLGYTNPAGASATVGLPVSGLISSATTSGLTFQLAAYTANNSLRIATPASGTLTFTTPRTAGNLYVLASSGSGISTVGVTITFTDGTTQAIAQPLTVADWYGGTGAAIAGIGRVSTADNLITNSAVDPRLYEYRLDILPANYTKLVQSVSFNKTSTTGVLNVMGISANPLCTGTPTAGTAVASATNTCASAAIVLSLTGTSTDGGLAYQWQSSTNGGTTFTDIAGATGPTYTVSGQTATTQYRARVTCAGSGLSDNSTAVTISSTAPTYATLPVLESFENTWINVCNTRDVPTAAWRNTPSTGNNSWRREDDGTAGAWVNPTSYSYTPTGSQGTHSARFHSGQASNGLIGTLDLYVDLSAAGAKRLSFDFINTSGVDSLVVQLSTNGGTTFGRLAGYSLSGTAAAGFSTQVLPITATSATCVLRFRGRADFGVTDIGLDNIVLEAATGCLTPANLTVGGTTATTASVSWLAGGTGTYSVLYGPTGFNPALPASATNVYTTASGIAGPPYTITGLTASTTYQFYVLQNCSATSTSGLAGPVSFTTACLTPVYATLPVTESFENTWISRCGTNEVPTNNWRNTPITGNNSWRRDDDGASAGWTSPTAYIYTPLASQGLHSARFHSGWVMSGIIGTLDLFVNLSPAGAKRLSFDLNNSAGSDSLVVQLSTDGGLTFGRLAGYGVTGAGFVTQVLPISSTSATAVIRFRGRGDYLSNDIGLDNIILESATGCLTPAALTATSTTTTTATLSWLTGGTGTYTVLYGPTGFNPSLPASGTNVYTTASGIVAPPYTVTGLTPGTTYQFYVTLNCSGTANSGTAGPATFNTQIVNDDPCGATVLTVNNACTPLATTTIGANTTASTVYTGGAQGAGCGSIAAPHDVWFTFVTAATGPTSTAVRITVTGGAASVVRGYSGTACTGPLTYLSCAGTASNTAAPNLDLTNLTPGTTYYVRVNEYSTTGVLGNFTICAVPVPNCPAPAGLTAVAPTSTTAMLSWSGVSGGTGSTYTVIYGPTGFQPTTGGTSITGLTGTSTTLNGLSALTTYQFYVQQVCGGFNGSSTLVGPISFTTPLTVPANDEPCAAVPLTGTAVTSTNVGATTSVQNGINTPACSPAARPQDVWFAFTASATTSTLTLTGSAAGMVRVYSSPSCTAGPFNQVFCQSSGANNTTVGTVPVTGLTVGTRYYVAVSGYGSSDTPGTFTVNASNILASKARTSTDALLVYPNPSNTGQLTLRLAGSSGPAQATLFNALGQSVRTQALPASLPEHALNTRGLATGVYTLRVQAGADVLTQKVVLE